MRNEYWALILGVAVLCGSPLWADSNGDQPQTPPGMNQPPVAGAPSMPKSGVPTLLIEFQEGHSEIPGTYSRTLDDFGRYLQSHPGSRAELAGYADHTGHGPANMELAQK